MKPSAKTRIGLFLLACLGVAGTASAQEFTFSYRSVANPSPTGVAANGEVDAPPTAVGQSGSVTLIIQNGTTATWTVANVATTGPVFKPAAVGTPQFGPGTTVLVPVNFTPTAAGTAIDNLSVELTTGGQTRSFNFLLSGKGLLANIITSYIMQPSGNQVAVANGAPITFPATNLQNTTSATFVILNTGSGPGTVNSVNITGSAFKISGLPLLPATIAAGNNDLRFTLSFTPTLRGSASGTLTINLGTSTLSFPLVGTATGAALTYTSLDGTTTSNLDPGATITLPSTALGGKSTVTIKVTNSGDANASVSAINIVGAGYTVASVPPLPTTVLPGASLSFNVVFTPQSAGPASGTLLIDGASFNLSSVAVGSSLVYNSIIGSSTTQLANSGTVVFPNANVGATSTVLISINNVGNAPASVSSVSVTGAQFSLPKPPTLPATIAAGGTLQFTVAFTANSTAGVSGVLQIDSFGVNLRGVGNSPPPVSALVFNNLANSASPLDQPLVSLTLGQPYPLDITGKVTLTFTSDSFADDPNIQFATGGRTVNFTIPANTTTAIFNGGAKSMQFQAGTVAGVIGVSATMAAGSVDLTPSPAPAQSVLVVAGAPLIRNVQIGTRTANSFEVLITGLSTPRQVSSFNLQFTPAAGANLQTTSLTVNTDAPFSTWFQSASGISFGSQFTASVIVNVNGDINAIQSVTVSAGNSRGSSNTVGANLR